MAAYFPLLTVVLTGLIAIPTYLLQKQFERKEEQRGRRAEAYERYLAAYWQPVSVPEAERRKEYNLARQNLFLLASDQVLRSMTKFDWYIVSEVEGPKNNHEKSRRYATMLKAMRADCFSKTKITEDEIGRLLPFPWNADFHKLDTVEGPSNSFVSDTHETNSSMKS